MAPRRKAPSPILGAVREMIADASDTLVTENSRFKHTFEVAIDKISPDPDQPRKHIDDEAIAELARTMEEHGQLQPILVRRDPADRRHYIIVAGERRYRAARLNGWPTLLAIEHDADPEIAALIENLQRVDLSPVDEARGLARLIEGRGWSQAEAAGVLGKAKSEISGVLRILTLPDDLLDAVLTSELTLPKNVLVELARIETPAVRDRLVALAFEGKLTVRALRAARAEDDGKPARAPQVDAEVETPAPRATPGRLSLRQLDRLALALEAAAHRGTPLSAAERERLDIVQHHIEALLSGN
ncbi:ParB/RepB/Spo0J family partition protein (plasmid) [Tistrella mobilis]|uniref:ParB/RepB/Spo0J family partition protein n=1 Tax=Tistrella mobilis TaxID=171437 RepID=UPI003556EE3B